MDTALQKSVAEQKSLFVQFTGSDWCDECVQLRKSVLSTQEFEKATKDKFIFVELDFPHKKKMEDEQRLKNRMWRSKLGIIGLPTVVLMDPKGLPYASIVGGFTNTEDFLTVMTAFERNRLIRDKALAQMEKASPKDKITYLVRALNAVPEESRHAFYAKEMKLIEELDKTDSTGFIKQQKYRQLLYTQELEIQNKLNAFRSEFIDGRTDELIQELTSMLQSDKWLPESRQKLLLGLLFSSKDTENKEKTLAQLDSIIQLSPRSQEATIARNIIRNLKVGEDEKNFENHHPLKKGKQKGAPVCIGR